MADKEGMERKVYLLPADLGDRIRAFQASQGLSSEVEAVRRLLDAALQLRDSTTDILKQLKARYAEEKDLRILARDILAGHVQITSVHFEDGAISFCVKDGERGRIDKHGTTYLGREGYDDGWYEHPAPRVQAKPPKTDLDDEIPF